MACSSLAAAPDSYPAIVVDRQEVVFPLAVFPTEAAPNPRHAQLVHLEHADRSAPRDQPLIQPPRFRRESVPWRVAPARHPHDPDPIADLQIAPRFAHRFLTKIGPRRGQSADRGETILADVTP